MPTFAIWTAQEWAIFLGALGLFLERVVAWRVDYVRNRDNAAKIDVVAKKADVAADHAAATEEKVAQHAAKAEDKLATVLETQKIQTAALEEVHGKVNGLNNEIAKANLARGRAEGTLVGMVEAEAKAEAKAAKPTE